MTDPGVRQARPTLARVDVRWLFLFFVVVYVADHFLTAWGRQRGVVEGNPLAEAWYQHGDTVALGMKAVGMGLVALVTVLVPRAVQRGDIIVRWALVFWSVVFLLIDLNSVIYMVLGLAEAIKHTI